MNVLTGAIFLIVLSLLGGVCGIVFFINGYKGEKQESISVDVFLKNLPLAMALLSCIFYGIIEAVFMLKNVQTISNGLLIATIVAAVANLLTGILIGLFAKKNMEALLVLFEKKEIDSLFIRLAMIEGISLVALGYFLMTIMK